MGVYIALPASRAAMTLALVFASVGALAMCLGLMRWPSIHWALADDYESAGLDARHGIAVLFLAGAMRNVASAVQPLADINNYLLPLWMIALGAAIIWFPRSR